MTEIEMDPRLLERKPAGGRPPLYPWSEWLDGTDKLIAPPKGKTPRSMQMQILREARRRGIFVETRRFGSQIGVYFHKQPLAEATATPLGPSPVAPKAFFTSVLEGKPGSIREQSRAGFTDDQWREYLIGEFLDRGADIAIEVDEADGLMHVVVTKRESDDDYE